MADKFVIRKQTRSKSYMMLNVSPETKAKVDQVSKDTGVPRVDVIAAMVDFAIDHLEVVDDDE